MCVYVYIDMCIWLYVYICSICHTIYFMHFILTSQEARTILIHFLLQKCNLSYFVQNLKTVFLLNFESSKLFESSNVCHFKPFWSQYILAYNTPIIDVIIHDKYLQNIINSNNIVAGPYMLWQIHVIVTDLYRYTICLFVLQCVAASLTDPISVLYKKKKDGLCLCMLTNCTMSHLNYM